MKTLGLKLDELQREMQRVPPCRDERKAFPRSFVKADETRAAMVSSVSETSEADQLMSETSVGEKVSDLFTGSLPSPREFR